jgi:hypothetical protein
MTASPLTDRTVAVAHLGESIIDMMAEEGVEITREIEELVPRVLTLVSGYYPQFAEFVRVAQAEAWIVQPTLSDLESGATPLLEGLASVSSQIERLADRSFGTTVSRLSKMGFEISHPEVGKMPTRAATA